METDYSLTLSRILNAYAPVGPHPTQLLLVSGTVETVKKNETVFHEQRFNGFEYFQFEGVSHRFNTDSESEALTTGIYQGEIVITPHFARTTNSQSIFSLQALTDCVYLKIPAGIFRDLRERDSHLRAFGQAVVEREFTRHMNFEVLFRSYSARDRLLYFREHFPQLENLIPHTVIASFLGITPVSLSRLRNELTKG